MHYFSLELGSSCHRKPSGRGHPADAGHCSRLVPLILLPVLAAGPVFADQVANSVHNLSVSGPGSIKANTETDICVFCHTVHRTTGQRPLWSHTLSSVTNYVIYSSPTLKATVGQPDGSSRLCLSCHDGTVALGMVSSRTTPISMAGGVTTLPTGAANLGTDLSADHPISFVYDQNLVSLDPELAAPSTLDRRVKLDSAQKLQCVTCHDPHDNQYGSFLVMDNTGSALCLNCHVQPGWTGSAHSISPTTTPLARSSTGPKTAQTVADKACENCHIPHKAGSKARLLIQAKEEQNCFTCHNGKVVSKDLAREFSKVNAHPVLQSSSVHNLAEDPVNSRRHAACSDCHNSHVAKASDNTGKPADRRPPTLGVKGLNASGAVVRASHEYELCFRCHAESLNRGPARVVRQFMETNKRLQFNVSNRSFHPVLTTGRSPKVPSLIQPWNTSSLMECTDCHNNDQGPKAGGSGPDGPHGSIFTPILERRLMLTDSNPENAGNYALCYKCHSRASILGNQSFKAINALGQDRGHRFHVVDQKTACTTCHESHGVATTSHLINFNTLYVQPTSSGRPVQYVDTGDSSGNCTLRCHGFDHVSTPYPVPPSGVSLSGRKLGR